MHRSTLATLSVAATAAALTFATNVPVATAQAASPAAAAKSSSTRFMVSSVGYASRVIGGTLPANSDGTAYQVIGCTNRAGINRTNTKADANLPGGISLSNLKTRTWTTKHGASVSAYSRQHIARVVLAKTLVGTLSIGAVESTTRAWHDQRGYHASATSDLANITFAPVAGPARHIRVPLPGHSVTVPGLAKLSLGKGTKLAGAGSARGEIDALKIHVIPTDTTVFLAHSAAAIRGGTPKALYRGSAFGLKADALEGVITSQRTPNAVTPCLGSGGKVASRDVAEVNPTAGVHARALSAATRSGVTHKGQPYVTNTAKVARIALGSGLSVTAVHARAHVIKVGKHFVKNARGTTLGRIILNGQTLELPRTGVLKIPGVARLETNIVEKTRNSIAITALRVTLLDGRVATVNVGYARSALLSTSM